MQYPSLVRTLLLLRGITTDEEVERFLHPDWERDTHDPFLMKDMHKAVLRIVGAMEVGETIAIWSDYDMDGIPGAVLLYDFFRTISYDRVLHHTPHRNKDGFGLNKVGIDELVEQGATLAITIDCGIGDVEMVAYAQEKGLVMIVTDHHIPHDTLPSAYAILNPKQPVCEYPEKMLCGAGVAFKLVQGLLTHLRALSSGTEKECEVAVQQAEGGAGVEAVFFDAHTSKSIPVSGWEKWLLDMAGMATIADMVPLTGENRALAYFGIVVLHKSRRLGLQALLRKARADQRHLNEDDIGFTIAPRINAASRMGHAKDAFALLSATDALEAGALADKLDIINTERKTLVTTMKREIHARIKKLGEPKSVIVMGNPDWKPSMLGLVAGGLAEEFDRPVFLWGREEGVTIKGSCRSGGGVSVYEVMHHAHKVFIEYGGHAQAGGFSVGAEEVHALETALIEAHAMVAGSTSNVERYVDAELTLNDITWDTYRAVAQLAPFGVGNPKPLFLLKAVVPTQVRTFGKGNEHLEVTCARSTGGTVKAIAFFTKPEQYPALTMGTPCTLVAHLEASYFGGKQELRLRLIDAY